MAGVKKSVKVQLPPAEFEEDTSEILVNAMFEAFDMLGYNGDKDICKHFYTLRIDATEDLGRAATITASEKR